MMRFIFPTLAFVILFFSACTETQDDLKLKISKLEAEVTADMAKSLDTNKIVHLNELYLKYAAKFPSDTLAPEYLYKSSGMYQTINQSDKAVMMLDSIVKTYPKYMRLPECIFTEAFIYENNLNDYGKASYYYNLFLMKYPNHPLAESASAGIKNLGKPLDQLIHEFEAKREEAQAKK